MLMNIKNKGGVVKHYLIYFFFRFIDLHLNS